MKTLKYFTLILILLNLSQNYSQVISLSKDSLFLKLDSVSVLSKDSLIIYNTGSVNLNIDTIYSTNASGLILDIILNDTTIHSAVTWRNSYYNPFIISPNDSAKLIFSYPLWVPKRLNPLETWADTIVIMNNSINNSFVAIYTIIDFPLDINDTMDELPLDFSLHQNYPNPFNPVTKIKFHITDFGFVTLKVYDVLGNEIATLVNEEKQTGTYEVEFNIHSDEGRNLASGIYFYQLKVGGPETSSGQGFIETKKMVLLR